MTPLIYLLLFKTSTFQTSYFNRIVKLWNYVCRLASPTSFCSPNAFQLFVRNLMNNISAYLKMHRLTIILNLEPYLLRNLKARADLRNITIHFQKKRKPFPLSSIGFYQKALPILSVTADRNWLIFTASQRRTKHHSL